MTAKHTPGPWKIEDDEDGAYIFAGSICIARPGDLHMDKLKGCVACHAELDATVELIRSAPEMADEIVRLKAELVRVKLELHRHETEADVQARSAGGMS